jgi:hypothetical protein
MGHEHDSHDDDSYLEGFLETAFTTLDQDLEETVVAGFRDPTELPPQHPRYEVLEHLGRGAVGDIYRVQDRDLGRRLALKVLRPAHLSDANLIEHLREEFAPLQPAAASRRGARPRVRHPRRRPPPTSR